MGWKYHNKPPLGWPLDYDSGLVPEAGFWLFNEGSGILVQDLSGNGNDGTLIGGDVDWIPGKFGSALSSPDWEVDYVSMGDTPTLNITGDLSISIWIYPTAAGNYPCMISRGFNEYSFVFYSGNRRPRLYISGENATTTSAVTLNVWTHLVVTHDGANAKFYINGVLDFIQALVERPDGNPNNLIMGHEVDIANWTFIGDLDMPSIYNRVLSASEVALLYQYPFWMFKDPAEVALLGGYQAVVGMAGAMTTNPGYWGW